MNSENDKDMPPDSDKTSPNQNSLGENTPSKTSPNQNKAYTARRQSYYDRVQQRKAMKRRDDNRFYAMMFSMMGILALFAILLSALAINGSNVDFSALQGWAQPWLGPVTKLEAAGVALVAVIAASAYYRMRKK